MEQVLGVLADDRGVGLGAAVRVLVGKHGVSDLGDLLDSHYALVPVVLHPTLDLHVVLYAFL